MPTSPVSTGSAAPGAKPVPPKIDTDQAVSRRGARWWQSYTTPILEVIHLRQCQLEDARIAKALAGIDQANAQFHRIVCSQHASVEYCWRQWERIMHLPRRLAGLLSDSSCLKMRTI